MARANGTSVKRKISVESSRPGKKRKAIGGQQAPSSAGRTRHGGAPTQSKKARAAKGPQDYFEADDSDPDEIKHSDRYDEVENYEYEMPSDFEDEEIDEEGAFTKEDEKKYGAWFEREVDADEDGNEDHDDDDDDDDIVGSEGTDAGEDDDDDGDLDNDDDREEPDGRPGRTQRRPLPDDEDDAGEGDEDDDDDGLMGFDDDGEDDDDVGLDLGGDDDDGDDGDGGGGGERHRRMISAVLGDAADKKKKAKKAALQVVSEAYPESEFNINAGAASAGERSGGLSVADLVAGLGDRRRKLTGSARRLLDKVAGGGSAPVSAPLPRIIKERQERKAGYEEAKKEVTKWQPIVKANREAPSLVFTSAKHEVPQTNTTASIVARFEPRAADAPTDAAAKQQRKAAAATETAGARALDALDGAEPAGTHAGATGDGDDDDDVGMGMEAEVAALLSRAGALSAKAVQEAEEKLALKSLTIEEVRERRERLAKLRALLFYSELKAKRMKAIKSKDYHRHLARAAKRKALKSGAADGADEAARQAAEEAEFDRARERLTLRHRNTSKWARRALKRGANITDDGTREALDEQLRLGQQLRRKMEGRKARDGSDDDSDASTSASDGEGDGSDGEEGGEGRGQLLGSSRARAAALDVLSGGDLPEDAPKKGLFALPFMARALEKKRQAAQLEAQQLLRELEEQEAADGTAATDDALGGLGAAAGASAGRRVFGGAGAAPTAVGYSAVDVDDLDGGGGGSGSDDDREDTEAKAERLTRLRSEATKVGPAGGKQQQQEAAASRRRHTRPTAVPATTEAAGAEDDGEGRAAAALLASSSEAGLDLSAAVVQRRRAPAAGAAVRDASGSGAVAGLVPFVKCGKFEGGRPGYIFKKGPKGVGYYVDSKQQPQQDTAARPIVVVAGTAAAASTAAATHTAPAKGKPAATGTPATGAAAAAPPGTAAGARKEHSDDGDDPADATAGADQDQDATGAPAGHMRPAPAGREAQMDLIRQAFAGDDVEAEFEAEKAQAITGELPDLPEPTALPGWGAWGVQQRSAKWVAQEREKINKVKAAAAASRKDASLKYVIVSETWDKKAAKYHAQQVPFPFDSAAVYEQSLRQPLGRQYNPDSAFRDLTRPAVVKTTGVVIEPARFAKAVAQHAQQISTGKAGTGPGRGLAAKAKADAAGARGGRPKTLTVAGGINKR